MNDEQLRQVLRRLPRRQASEDFTARVLEGIEGASASPSPALASGLGSPLLRWILATGAALVLAIGPLLWFQPRQETAEDPMASLRQEHQRLQQEVRELRELLETGEPMLYLGGDGHYDVYLPLEEVPPGRSSQDLRSRGPENLRVLPAAWKSY